MTTKPRIPAAAATATATQRVYDGIYGAIVEHRLSAGQRLREEELAESFQVSRTVVRQALHRLAADHVIELRHNIGAQVPQPDLAQAAHVFDARRVIESDIARRLAGRLLPTQLQALRQLVAAEAAAGARGETSAAIRLSGEFHRELARLAGNPVFARWIDELLPMTSLLIALFQRDSLSGCLLHDHGALVDALAKETPARCATLMRQHLVELERSLAQAAPVSATPLRDVFAAYRDEVAPETQPTPKAMSQSLPRARSKVGPKADARSVAATARAAAAGSDLAVRKRAAPGPKTTRRRTIKA